jgi:hypothetical protein
LRDASAWRARNSSCFVSLIAIAVRLRLRTVLYLPCRRHSSTYASAGIAYRAIGSQLFLVAGGESDKPHSFDCSEDAISEPPTNLERV